MDRTDTAPYSEQQRRRNDDGVSAKDMSHEERREREKPTRTLFIRNIPYEANHHELNDIFASYGKLARFYNLISKRGMAFVTYYDLRDADRAKRALQGHMINDRPINIHYSLPRDDDMSTMNSNKEGEPDPTKAPSSIFVLIRDATEEISNEEVKEFFSKWGDVKEVRDGKGKTVVTKFVDYWDTRDAEKACEAANGQEIKSGKIEARYALQTGRKPTATLASMMRGDRGGFYDSYSACREPPRDAYDSYYRAEDRRDFGPYGSGSGGGGGAHYDAYRGYAPSSGSSGSSYSRDSDQNYGSGGYGSYSGGNGSYSGGNGSYSGGNGSYSGGNGSYSSANYGNGSYSSGNGSYSSGNGSYASGSGSYGPSYGSGGSSYGNNGPSSGYGGSSYGSSSYAGGGGGSSSYGSSSYRSSHSAPSSNYGGSSSSSSYTPPPSSYGASSAPPLNDDQSIINQINQLQSMLSRGAAGQASAGSSSSYPPSSSPPPPQSSSYKSYEGSSSPYHQGPPPNY